MKSIFLASVALCVFSVIIKDASCKSLGSIQAKSIGSNKYRNDMAREETANNMLVSDEVLRTKRNIVNNIACPINMRKIINCLPIRNLRRGKYNKRKHGHHSRKNKKI